MFTFSPFEGFIPNVFTKALESFSAYYFVVVISPSHKNGIKDSNLIVGTKVSILSSLLNFGFKSFDIFFGWFDKENRFTFVAVLSKMEPKKVESFLDPGLVSFLCIKRQSAFPKEFVYCLTNRSI